CGSRVRSGARKRPIRSLPFRIGRVVEASHTEQSAMPSNHTGESSPEHSRLQEDREGQAAWKKWGPYLSERQWGTVREDYSPDGDAWNYFTHDHAQYPAY